MLEYYLAILVANISNSIIIIIVPLYKEYAESIKARLFLPLVFLI
jgi:hypothetical protein